jgi:hypothetical protein
MRLRASNKTPKLPETWIFATEPHENLHPQERHFRPGPSTGVSLPENG